MIGSTHNLTAYSRWMNLPLLVGLMATLLFACYRVDYREFNPETVKPIPKEKLDFYANLDSTLPILEGIKSDRQRLDSLILYAEWVKNYADTASLSYAERAYDLATDNHWQYARAVSAYRMAVLKERNAKFGEDIEDAFVDINISKRIFDQTQVEHWKILVNSFVGILYYRKNELDSARHYLTDAKEEIEQILQVDSTFEALLGDVLLNLANTHDRTESQLTSEYYRQCENIFRRIGNWVDLALLWNNMGSEHLANGAYHLADSLFNLAIEFGRTQQNTNVLIDALQQKAYLLLAEYQYHKESTTAEACIDLLQECLRLRKNGQHQTYFYLAQIYQARAYFERNGMDTDSSIYFYDRCIKSARKDGALNLIHLASGSLLSYCIEYDNPSCAEVLDTNALDLVNLNYAAVIDTITSHANAAFKRTNQVTQREIIASEGLKRRNQRFYWLGALIIAALVFFIIYQQLQQKRLQAKMEALRAQINPHFISNSLNAIENLVNQDQKKAASKYIIHFSRLSRRILNSSLGAITTLDQELKTAEHFLALEKLRFPNKLEYEIRVQPELDTTEIQIPALLLQPYLENAIWHGIKPKDGSGVLSLSTKVEGKFLICTIEDDGIGRQKAGELKAKRTFGQKSVGMQITKERIQSFSKTKGTKVQIEDLYDSEEKASGTRVVITLPLKLKKIQTDEQHTRYYRGR